MALPLDAIRDEQEAAAKRMGLPVRQEFEFCPEAAAQAIPSVGIVDEESIPAPLFDQTLANGTGRFRVGYIRWSRCGDEYPLMLGGRPDAPTPVFAAYRAYCESPKHSKACAAADPWMHADAYRQPMIVRPGAYPTPEQKFAYSDSVCQHPMREDGVPRSERFLTAFQQLTLGLFGDLRRSPSLQLSLPCPVVTVLPLSRLQGVSRDTWDELLKDKAVVLGADISGIPDLIDSPVHGQIPGAVWHGMALDNLVSLKSSYLAQRHQALKTYGGFVLLLLFAYAFPFILHVLETKPMKVGRAWVSFTLWMLLAITYWGFGDGWAALFCLAIGVGLDLTSESEDELAALLGHELSHLILKHPQDKDVLRALPLGIETMASMKDAAAELKGQKATYSADLARFDPNSMSDMQATSVLWSDFISPSWNRNQEREADENGFELMRAAGYDASAFGLLFSKLQAAQAQRTERMKVLKKALVARLRGAAAAKTSAPASSNKAEAVAVTNEVKNGVADTASEKMVDGLSAFNRSYDSPDERQANLAAYAREHREKKRAPHPEPARAQSLKGGEGGTVLSLDTSAITTLDALNARNAAAAKKAVQGLGKEDAKQPSAHLNLAMGSYHQVYGRHEIGPTAAQAWITASHPPAQAFLWSASYQVKGKDFPAALETLETGRKRVGDSTPFLPTLVAVARASGNMPLARDYTRQCREESNKKISEKLQSLVSEQSVPKGLYAECVRQLGEVPPEDAVTESVTDKARDSVRKLFKKE